MSVASFSAALLPGAAEATSCAASAAADARLEGVASAALEAAAMARARPGGRERAGSP